MSLLSFWRCFPNSFHHTCIRRGDSCFPIILTLQRLDVLQTFFREKHWNPKFKKERKNKVLKIDLPDYDEIRRESKLSIEEMKAKLKERGIAPFRPWNEKPMFISCLGDIVDPYIPPEGDGKVSGVKQVYDGIGKKGKSYLALRKIRSYDYEFDIPTVAEEVKEIYIEAQKALANKNEDKLHDLVTEKAFPEMMENLKNKIVKWDFIQTLEPPRIVHIRCQDIMQKDNMFAQLTLRLFSQQKIVVHDRFGRLMHGSENIVKDVLEYVVFEKHITSPYGVWRIHGKVIPDWLPPKEPIKKTYILPDIDANFPEPPTKSVEISEHSSEPRSDAVV